MTTFADGVYQYGGIPVGGLGIGRVYIVADTTSSAYQYLQRQYNGAAYDDAAPVLYGHTSTSTVVTLNGLKAALAKTVTDRNDYVIVMPSSGTYYIDELLTLNKKAVHLICPASMICDVGCTNAARIQQIGSSLSIISVENGGIEIAGLYLKNMPNFAHIQVPTTASIVTPGTSAWGNCIHHNFFVSKSTTTTLPMLHGDGDGMSYSRIEKNWFTEQTSSGAWTTGVIELPGAANCEIVGNHIIIGDSGNATYGIYCGGAKNVVAKNLFSECGSSTIACCIAAGATSAVIGNRCAVAATHFSDAGGTASVSYVDNQDGVTEGTGGVTAQLAT